MKHNPKNWTVYLHLQYCLFLISELSSCFWPLDNFSCRCQKAKLHHTYLTINSNLQRLFNLTKTKVTAKTVLILHSWQCVYLLWHTIIRIKSSGGQKWSQVCFTFNILIQRSYTSMFYTHDMENQLVCSCYLEITLTIQWRRQSRPLCSD